LKMPLPDIPRYHNRHCGPEHIRISYQLASLKQSDAKGSCRGPLTSIKHLRYQLLAFWTRLDDFAAGPHAIRFIHQFSTRTLYAATWSVDCRFHGNLLENIL